MEVFRPLTNRPSILCLGAHSDDIEIGCGGTLLGLIKSLQSPSYWIVFSANGRRNQEARLSFKEFTGNSDANLDLLEYRDAFFPAHYDRIKRDVVAIRDNLKPDMVFTHCRTDLHQDHRLIAEVTWQVFRDNMVLEYEIPKYDGDLGRPNVYNRLSANAASRKIEILMNNFASQRDKAWFTEDTFRALMRIRGMECRAPSGYAEAFYGRKVVLQLGSV